MTDKNNTPCHPGCQGLDVFDSGSEPPRGWVEIQRCDECATYATDMDAAMAVSPQALYYNPETGETAPIATRGMTPLWSSLQCVVPAIDAFRFGLGVDPDDMASPKKLGTIDPKRPGGPDFEHDCYECRLLGHFNGHDLYLCGEGDASTVLARYSDRGSAYKSGLTFGKMPLSDPHTSVELRVAYLIAKDKGLLGPKPKSDMGHLIWWLKERRHNLTTSFEEDHRTRTVKLTGGNGTVELTFDTTGTFTGMWITLAAKNPEA